MQDTLLVQIVGYMLFGNNRGLNYEIFKNYYLLFYHNHVILYQNSKW